MDCHQCTAKWLLDEMVARARQLTAPVMQPTGVSRLSKLSKVHCFKAGLKAVITFKTCWGFRAICRQHSESIEKNVCRRGWAALDLVLLPTKTLFVERWALRSQTCESGGQVLGSAIPQNWMFFELEYMGPQLLSL